MTLGRLARIATFLLLCGLSSCGGPSDREGEENAPADLVPVLGALCDFIERCPEDLVPMATRSRGECIDVLYFFLTCRIDSVGTTFTLERVALELDAAQLASCREYFDGLACGELACEEGSDCGSEASRAACALLFSGIGSDDEADDDVVDAVCSAHEQCPTGSFCQLPAYSEDEQQMLCAACVPPIEAGEPCSVGWSGVAVPCVEGYVCGPNWDDDTPTTCTPPRAEGEGCISDADCAGGFCVPAIARCHDGGFENDLCDDPRKCRPGLLCVSERCVPARGPGESCTTSEACSNGYCDPTSGECGIPDGATCDQYHPDRCQSGYCASETQTCGQRPPPSGRGEPCTDAGQCEEGLACDGTCYEPCSSDGDCPGQRCDFDLGGRCAPRLEAGAECRSDDECVSSFCNDSTDLCSDPPAVGTACEEGGCGLALTCVSGQCAERAGPGDSCSGYDGCLAPYVCLAGRCELFPLTCEPAPRGQRCAALRVCDAESYCDYMGDITCIARKEAGEACAGFPEEECGAGLYCDLASGSSCAPRTEVGATCDGLRPCVESAVCVEGTCVEVPGGAQPCEHGEDCPAGTYCDDREELCVPLRGAGQGCDEYDAPCERDLYCSDAEVCAPLPSAPEPCLDGRCAADSFCEGETCAPRGGEGEACTESYVDVAGSCALDLLCESSVCVDKRQPGESCYEGDEVCATGLCDRSANLCVDELQCFAPSD